MLEAVLLAAGAGVVVAFLGTVAGWVGARALWRAINRIGSEGAAPEAPPTGPPGAASTPAPAALDDAPATLPYSAGARSAHDPPSRSGPGGRLPGAPPPPPGRADSSAGGVRDGSYPEFRAPG
jgi:hypothetical protein